RTQPVACATVGCDTLAAAHPSRANSLLNVPFSHCERRAGSVGLLTRPHAYGDAFALSPCSQAGILSLPRAGETMWHSFCLITKVPTRLAQESDCSSPVVEQGEGSGAAPASAPALTTLYTGNRASARASSRGPCCRAPLHRPPHRRLPHKEGARMRKRFTLHRLWTHRRYRYTAGLSQRTRRLRRKRVWRTRGLAALVTSGILLLVAAVLGTALPSR